LVDKPRPDKFYETNERTFISQTSNPVKMKDALYSLKNDLDLMFPSANVTSFQHRPSLSMDRFEKLKSQNHKNLKINRTSKSEHMGLT
jgi:hypothetical protein